LRRKRPQEQEQKDFIHLSDFAFTGTNLGCCALSASRADTATSTNTVSNILYLQMG